MARLPWKPPACSVPQTAQPCAGLWLPSFEKEDMTSFLLCLPHLPFPTCLGSNPCSGNHETTTGLSRRTLGVQRGRDFPPEPDGQRGAEPG